MPQMSVELDDGRPGAAGRGDATAFGSRVCQCRQNCARVSLCPAVVAERETRRVTVEYQASASVPQL
ncbi:hypothetical protein CCMA1212_007914 [Trichoderma ghanense]|uniref:Uncharacterized protein n=1 Tax=Trichoderma ghanense TaxID=65468 RepID=A0ABY2GXY1_9HYPO